MDGCVFDNVLDCRALREKKCAGCPFRKTKEELNKGREKSLDRIAILPQKQRTHILRKYYRLGRGVDDWYE